MSAAPCCSGNSMTSTSAIVEASGLMLILPQRFRTNSNFPRVGGGRDRLSGLQWSAYRTRTLARAALKFSPELAGKGEEHLPPRKSEPPGPLDELFLKFFRDRMAEGVGWESPKPGYDGLLEVVNHLYTNSSKSETERAAVRIFKSLFPAWILLAFRKVVLPIGSGKVAAVLMAFVTQATTRWLMGPSSVNEVTLADGSTLPSGVLVERCKFLEESRCAGICTHMCKIPTQEFFKTVMGVPVAMVPNFDDFSCQFNIGVESLPRDQDPGLQTGCLAICPTASARYLLRQAHTDQCPQVR